MDQHPLLVIFHDPPNIRVEPDPITGKVELHNSWLVSFPGTVLRCVDGDADDGHED
jgi:hypothetical protein